MAAVSKLSDWVEFMAAQHVQVAYEAQEALRIGAGFVVGARGAAIYFRPYLAIQSSHIPSANYPYLRNYQPVLESVSSRSVLGYQLYSTTSPPIASGPYVHRIRWFPGFELQQSLTSSVCKAHPICDSNLGSFLLSGFALRVFRGALYPGVLCYLALGQCPG